MLSKKHNLAWLSLSVNYLVPLNWFPETITIWWYVKCQSLYQNCLARTGSVLHATPKPKEGLFQFWKRRLYIRYIGYVSDICFANKTYTVTISHKNILTPRALWVNTLWHALSKTILNLNLNTILINVLSLNLSIPPSLSFRLA